MANNGAKDSNDSQVRLSKFSILVKVLNWGAFPLSSSSSPSVWSTCETHFDASHGWTRQIVRMSFRESTRFLAGVLGTHFLVCSISNQSTPVH
jgi:hypothetical protein